MNMTPEEKLERQKLEARRKCAGMAILDFLRENPSASIHIRLEPPDEEK